MKNNKKHINEAEAPVQFVNQDDMCVELGKYCYAFFDSDDEHIKELGKGVYDISWDFNVAGITLNEIKRGKPTIVVNPFFAEKLLDKAADKHHVDWNFNEDEDEFPEDYYEYFRYALLWASYLALVIRTEPISTSNADAYINSWKNNVSTVYHELVESFPEYREAQEVFREILEEFAMSRI